jgi:diadenosine tetraphosphate (Ap4A) HIT family hydrolase
MNCPFCNISEEKFIADSEFAFAVDDIHPVSKGHSLVIPKIHVENYFDLELVYQIACWEMVNKLKNILESKYKPDGYNVGLNINRVAGQSVLHAHIHIIPRYKSQANRNFAIENMALKDF